MRRRSLLSLAVAATALSATIASAQPAAPAEIKIGTLYAGSGAFASISQPVFSGLKLRIDQLNAGGGAMIKPYGKKIPLKLIAYDDQSNPATATTLMNQLITQDKVDILVSDSGSVLAATAVPVAREHKMVLFNHSGTGASLFAADNPYIVLTATPYSGIWPRWLADFLAKQGPGLGLKRIAILYATNEFTGTQANAVRSMLKASSAPVEIVYDQGVPTTTSNYTVIINNIMAANPDAVVELGYPNNDIAFLRNLQDSGNSFKFLFTVYTGLETEELEKTVGVAAMTGVFSYVTADAIDYKADFGPTVSEFRTAFAKAYPGGKVEFGFNAIAGYTTGLIIEKALATTDSMEQLAIRKAVADLSGKITTLDGPFAINEMGQQVGAVTPLGQLAADGKGLKINPVWPADVATAKPIIGK